MTYKGSEWKCWDLHVHTPMSIVQNYGDKYNDTTWEKYISDLEKLPDSHAVVGINDYFFLDGYERLVKEQKENGRLGNIILLPVVEFRLESLAGINFGKLKRANFHVIFSNDLSVDIIRSQFLNTLQQHYHIGTDGEQWQQVVTYDSLADLGKKIKDSVPENKRSEYPSDLVTGFHNINLKKDDIYAALNKDCFKDKFITAIGKTEWDSYNWSDSSIAIKKTIINRPDIVFTAAESIEKFNIAKAKLSEQGVNSNLLDCSDAHSLSSKTELKDRIGNCFTWIKADRTFEGLKQVIYEPKHRVFIGENAPKPPHRVIDKINLSFPTDTKINRSNADLSKVTPFCLRGHHEISFSPYFTCLIGGRGSGKSTILNLIAEAIGEHSIFSFHSKLYHTENNSLISSITDYIKIEANTEVEYISQNEVESFAQNKEELTNAIYNRITQNPKDNIYTQFTNLEKKITNNINDVDEHIKRIRDLFDKNNELAQVQSSFENDKKIIERSQDPTYIDLTQKIRSIGRKITGLTTSESRFTELSTEVNNIIEKYSITLDEDNTNLIEEQIAKIISKLAETKTFNYDSSTLEQSLKSYQDEQLQLSAELEDYLKKLGLSQENINDYEKAVKSIPTHRATIESLKSQITVLEKSSKEYNERCINFKNDRENLELLIKQNLLSLNEKLKSSNPNIKDISFHYQFDNDLAHDKIFDEFWQYFHFRSPSTFDLNTDAGSVKRRLIDKIPPQQILSLNRIEFLSKFDETDTTQAQKYISEVFSDDVYFDIFKLIIFKALINPINYKWITGAYDGKELSACSFGQRCTAVIVALLSFGINPLIIDEPEAHLDSKLIAEYLVNLIKEKKVDRQIIFATHNANFVVNGDAELILYLGMDENNKTIITPISIENIEHREKLLSLEGGIEAFRKRDKRLIKE